MSWIGHVPSEDLCIEALTPALQNVVLLGNRTAVDVIISEEVILLQRSPIKSRALDTGT
jgi:hypothetical protein